MKNIDIQLRIKKVGSVLSWQVFLESVSSNSFVKSGWVYNSKEGYFYIKLNDYPIQDQSLDVFVGCEGKIGGKVICTVFIDNNEQAEKIVSNNTDSNYSNKSFVIN